MNHNTRTDCPDSSIPGDQTDQNDLAGPVAALDRQGRAADLFKQGYNCAQSTMGAYADLIGLTTEEAMKIASSFGGGMGRLREVCGALSGVFMAAGLLYGYDNVQDDQAKSDHYALIQRIAQQFKSRHGSLLCRDLLQLDEEHSSPVPEERTQAYYKERPCQTLVYDAVEVFEAIRSTL